MLANVYYYRREANRYDTLEKYAADLPFDRLDRMFLRRGILGFSLTGVILVLLIGFGPVSWRSLHSRSCTWCSTPRSTARATPSATRASRTTRRISDSWL